MRTWRQIKKVLLVAIPLCFIGIVWVCARKIVSNTGMSLNDVKQEALGDEEDDSENMVVEKEFEDGEGQFRKATVLFDDSNLEERQKNYLGDDYSKYKTALLEIADTYQVVFDKIPTPDEDVDYSFSNTYSRYDKDLFSDEFVNSGDFVYIPTGFVNVVGMYGEYCVVYRFISDDSSNLLVVDYSNSLQNTEMDDLINFGDSLSLMIGADYSTLLTRGNYKLLYLKEF